MDLSSGKGARGVFTALAVAVAAAAPLHDAGAFGTGSSSSYYGNNERYFHLDLDDGQGGEVSYRLPMPEENPEAFQENVIAVLGDYITRADMNLTDRKASEFSWMIDWILKDIDMDKGGFLDAIGLDRQVFEGFEYQRQRYEILGDFDYIRNFREIAPDDLFFASHGLTTNDLFIAEANAKIEEAREQYPDDPAFAVEPLTAEDLRDVRRAMAERFADFGLELIEILDNRGYGAERHAGDAIRMIELLYVDIHRPLDDYHHLAEGNAYNRELPAMVDEALAERGCTDRCREEFFEKLVNFVSYRDRTLSLEPAPPAPVEP